MKNIHFLSDSETVSIENKFVSLVISKETGNIVRLHDKRVGFDLIRGSLEALSVAFVINDEYLIPDREHGFSTNNISFSENDEAGKLTLSLTDERGLWEIKQIFSLRKEEGLIEREAAIKYSGEKKQKMQALAFIIPKIGFDEPKDWSYQILGAFPPERVYFNNLSEGREVGDAITAVIIHHSPSKCNLLSFFYSEMEEKYLQIKEGKDTIELVHFLPVQARLDQKRNVSIGFQCLYSVPGDYKKGLAGFQNLYDLIGLKYPDDSPEWVRSALIFQCHPGGCMETECRDIGGSTYFKEHYLPHIHKLGFNTMYFLPVMQAHGGPYVGWDFYKIDERAGSEEELKSLVQEAHKLNIRVMYDIVPLGRSFDYPDLKKFEKWMCKDEEGNYVKSWGVLCSLDYTHKEYQEFIAKVAEHYIREHDIDGYRVDSAFGDSPNWDPARTDRPTASAHGGIAMMEKMRKAIKRVKRDAALLPEVFNRIEFFKVSDFIYDYSLFGIFSKFYDYSPAEWCNHLKKWLELQKYITPKGAVWMRFVSNHDTFRAASYYGIGLARALNAICTLIEGNLLFYMMEEIGSQHFYQKLFTLRKALPELNYGTASYEIVKCSKEEVFTCLREYEKACSVVAVNLTPEKMNVQIKFPIPKSLREWKRLALIDSWNAKPLGVVETESLTEGEINVETSIEGYECSIITIRPLTQPQNLEKIMKKISLLA